MDLQAFGVSIYLIQVIFGAVDLPAKLVGFLVINSLGRRPAQMASLLLAGVCILVNGVIPQGEHPRVPWSFIFSPISRFSSPTPELPLAPSFLSRSVHCPNLPCRSGERLPGYLLQLHLPIYWGAVPHGDPVSGSQVGGGLGQDSPPHIGQTPEPSPKAPPSAHQGKACISHSVHTPWLTQVCLPTKPLPEPRKRSQKEHGRVDSQEDTSYRQLIEAPP